MVTISSGVERWAAEGEARVELGYAPFPKQQQFHASPAKYRLFGGAAGPGKSKALLMEAILQAHEHPGANTLLLRRTFPELEQSLLLYFRRDVPRELYQQLSRIEARGDVAERVDDALRLLPERERCLPISGRRNFFLSAIDELTHVHAAAVAISDEPQSVSGAGGVSVHGRRDESGEHRARVGEGAVDRPSRPRAGMEHPEEYDAADYEFIPARVCDNPIYAAGRKLSEDAAGAAVAFAAGVSGWRLGCFRRAVFRPVRSCAARGAGGRDRLEAVVAAVDFDRLGIRASGGGVLARGDAEALIAAKGANGQGRHLPRIRDASNAAAGVGAGDCGAERAARAR